MMKMSSSSSSSSSSRTTTFLGLVLALIVIIQQPYPTEALGVAAAATAAGAGAVLKDHSSAVAGLFNNMRTPAALIGGALVPIGMLTAPTITKDDTKFDRVVKRVNILVAVSSLLSEVLAVVYASIAINKLTEVPSPLTTNVADLISQKYELAWLGTNIHFLYGLLGFGLIVGGKAYFLFGNPVGKIALLCTYKVYIIFGCTFLYSTILTLIICLPSDPFFLIYFFLCRECCSIFPITFGCECWYCTRYW